MQTTTNTSEILAPDQIGSLLVQPMLDQSIAAQVATVVSTSSSSYRMPVVKADPTAAWIAEGAEIAPTDADIDEVVSTPAKVAGLTILTRELADDSNPAAASVVGEGLARDIARKVDQAFFGSLASPAPSGLGALPDAKLAVVSAGASFTNVDPFVEALSLAEFVGAKLSAFVASPGDALALAKVKKATGSNEALMTPDPSQPSGRVIAGVPLFVSSAVASGTVWGIPADRTFVVVRDGARIEVDRSVFFTSDRVAVKGTMRVGVLFAHTQAIVKIKLGA